MCLPFVSRLSFPPVRFVRTAAGLLGLFAILLALAPFAVAASKGQISGTISSKSTGNALQGARVSVPALNRSTLTDNTGHFVLFDLPAQAVELVVSYDGFTEATQSVDVSAGPAAIAVEMQSSDVVTLEKFTVSSIKEGQALAITEQRNAGNIKSVKALDEWGILPTQNVGELAARMPGITFTTDEDDLIFNVSIRGQPDSYTRLNIDGLPSTGVSGIGRTATLHSFSASNYESIEIIAGQTPDKRADSLGGQLNLKTKSPLAMREKRRFTYSAAGRYFPGFADRNVSLAADPIHPELSASYTEVFDLFGGKRNFGIAINAAYQEVVNGIDYDLLQYQNTIDPVAYFQDYDKRSGLNHRLIYAFSARADWRISDTTRMSLRFLNNNGNEPHYDRVRVNPFGPRTVFGPTTPNGAVVPGFTANRTEIRPVAGTRFDVETWNFSFVSKNPTGTLEFEHNWGRLKVDHSWRWSHTTWESLHGGNGQGGQYTSRLNAPLGFILDNSDLNGRVFTQTAGPNVYNFANYAPIVLTNANSTTQPVPITSRRFDQRDTATFTNEVTGTVNATYDFDTSIPFTVKVGLDSVNRRVNNLPRNIRRWYGVPGSVLDLDLMPLSEFERQHGGNRLPAFIPAAVSKTLNDPALWFEDVNFNATQRFTNRRIMEEGVDSAYVQATTKLGHLTVLGGVRREWVTTDTFTFFRARTTPIAVEPDHAKRALLDFRSQVTEGSYAQWFPSLHLGYDITPDLKARASFSKSYGRATLQQLVPTVAVNEATQIVTIGNPALRPQVAKNYDFKLEYYFKSDGLFSVGVFRKDITDFISGTQNSGEIVPNAPDNGFDGLFGGFTIFRPGNIGSARAEGLELDFKKRLTFLPDPLKGLTLSVNYTYQRTAGKFAGTTELKTNNVVGFVPRLFNARLQYAYKKFGASFDASVKGSHILNFNAASPGLRFFQSRLTRYNVGISYRIRPDATFFLNADNISEAGPRHFAGGVSARVRQQLISPVALKFGITGQF